MLSDLQPPPTEDTRSEIKFWFDQMLYAQAYSLIRLHPCLFYEPYPPRWVNSLYLDSINLDNYFDNVNGANSRQKVRVRWYGDLFGDIAAPILEFKLKNGKAGWKLHFPIRRFTLDQQFSQKKFHEILLASSYPPEMWEKLRDLRFVLLNRYHRRYFATHDGRFRLTLDNNMCYYKVNPHRNLFIHKQLEASALIVELKNPTRLEAEAQRLASYFPFRQTKSSKYIQGIERVY